MKINKKLLILIVLIIAALLFAVIYTVAVGSRFTAYTNTFVPNSSIEKIYASAKNEDVIELADARIADDGEIILDFAALGEGKTDVDVNVKTRFTGQTELTENPFTFTFTVTGLGVIINNTKAWLNFQGYPVVLFVIMFILLISLVFIALMFFEYLKDGDFNYRMIACIGFGIFFAILLAFLLYKRANHALRYFQSFLTAFLDIGFEIFLAIAPVMLLLSVLLAVSNIWLMRHEGYRPVNALGIVFAIVWMAGTGLILYSNVITFIFHIVDPGLIQKITLYLCCYFGSMFIATVICAYLATKYRPPLDRDYIIILGCGIRSDGTLTPLLKGRVDAALEFEKEQFEKTGKHAVFVPSGGQGPDEVISESQAMKNYLLSQGIPEDLILMEDKSTNTMQNMQFSKEVIEQHAEDFSQCKIAFSTTNYHIFRGYILAKKNGFIAKGISAKTKKYFFPNAFLREYIGLLVDRKYTHIFFVLITLAVFVLTQYLEKL